MAPSIIPSWGSRAIMVLVLLVVRMGWFHGSIIQGSKFIVGRNIIGRGMVVIGRWVVAPMLATSTSCLIGIRLRWSPGWFRYMCFDFWFRCCLSNWI